MTKYYINFEGTKIALTDEIIEQLRAIAGTESKETDNTLKSIATGDTFKLGNHEFIVLEHLGDATVVILKDLLFESTEFSEENNNYKDSNVDKLCIDFGNEIEGIVGKGNLLAHVVDLTSDDGLKDYGTVNRFMSLITANMYRKYVEIFDKYKLDAWWWLATPWSTPRHEDSVWVKCVSPHGVGNNGCNYYCGVRPFLIFSSSISVSYK